MRMLVLVPSQGRNGSRLFRLPFPLARNQKAFETLFFLSALRIPPSPIGPGDSAESFRPAMIIPRCSGGEEPESLPRDVSIGYHSPGSMFVSCPVASDLSSGLLFRVTTSRTARS